MSKFEQSRPDHEVHEIHRPQGHGMMDQKRQKGMRSPVSGSVPAINTGTMPSMDGTSAPPSAPMNPSMANGQGEY